MNGLKYIRTRCNLSLNELSEMIGVTRQAMSAWENDRKEIPEQRKEQLGEFFGIDKEFFGEITDEEKEYLLGKAMFRYSDGTKEFFKYKPDQESEEFDACFMWFFEESDMSLDEQYVVAQKQKQAILEEIDDYISWEKGNDVTCLHSQIMSMRRGCKIYKMMNDLMGLYKSQKAGYKVPFCQEFMSVMKAMLIAYGLMDEAQVWDGLLEGDERIGEWTLQLSKQLKEHWEQEYAYQEHYKNVVVPELIKEDKEQHPENFRKMTMEEKIQAAEEDNRKFQKEHNDSVQSMMIYF